MDLFPVVYLVVIVVCVPAVAYLLPQDPAVVRLVTEVSRRRRHRKTRRWVEQQRRSQL